MKLLVCALTSLLFTTPLWAASSSTLFLRGYVPGKAKVVVDSKNGTYVVLSNSAGLQPAMHVTEELNSQGLKVVTITPQ